MNNHFLITSSEECEFVKFPSNVVQVHYMLFWYTNLKFSFTAAWKGGWTLIFPCICNKYVMLEQFQSWSVACPTWWAAKCGIEP